jgi:thioredoxin-related protein
MTITGMHTIYNFITLTVAGCIFCNKLPNNIKQINNNNQFKKELKELLIKGCYYLTDDYLNEGFCNTGY